MKHVYKKIINSWYLLRCFILIGLGCFKVLCLRKPCSKQHLVINLIAKSSSIKILKIIKTSYYVHYTYPFTFEKNTAYIFMSNHQSLIDLILICATMPGTVRFVAKEELFKIPLFGSVLKKGGCIPVDRKNPMNMMTFFKTTKEILANGICLWIFPEGTRSPDGKLLPFKMGCFRLARESGAKIIPVGIVNTKSVLPFHQSSFNFHQSITIRFGRPIDTHCYLTPDSQKSLANKVRDAIEELLN